MNNRTTNQSTGTSSCRYYMFHRQDMHKMLMDTATQEQGTGTPVKLVVNHKVHPKPYLYPSHPILANYFLRKD